MRRPEEEQSILIFKQYCSEYLETLGIAELRSYGRHVGVAWATKRKKKDLIETIMDIFIGEIPPVERSKRGAPIKDDRVDKKILEKINAYRQLYLAEIKGTLPIENYGDEGPAPMDFSTLLQGYNSRPMRVQYEFNSDEAEVSANGVKRIFRGQFHYVNKVALLFPLSGGEAEEKIVVLVEHIQQYDLLEGDVITCYARNLQDYLIATQLLTINGIEASKFQRTRFDLAEVCYPRNRIVAYEKNTFAGITNKFFDWLIPFGKGQRALVLSEPKSGKTQLLLQVAKAVTELNEDVDTYALLIEPSPETIGEFRKIMDKEHLLYTTYDETPERQIFVADFLLQRIKRQVETGRHVLLFVDSFNDLARVYNETEESAGGKLLPVGLETKTMQYLKKYLGSGRCLEESGSLTIVGSVSLSTGNPADDYIATELSRFASLTIRLDDEMARKRVFPALDFNKISVRRQEYLLGAQEDEFDALIRKEYLTKHTMQELLVILAESDSCEYFRARIQSEL